MINEKNIKLYVIEKIKKASWQIFHQAGEVFFDYLDTDENNNESTEEYWDEFLINLINKEIKIE